LGKVVDCHQTQVAGSFNYEVVDAETGAVFMNGYTQHICLDRAGKVTRIPDYWQGFLRQGAPSTGNVSEHT